MSQEPKASIVSESERGSYVVPIHRSRNVKIYPLLESELERLGEFSTQATFFFSVAFLFFGLGGGCAWDMLNAKEPSSSSAQGTMTLLFLAGGISLAYALYATWKRSIEMKRIRENLG